MPAKKYRFDYEKIVHDTIKAAQRLGLTSLAISTDLINLKSAYLKDEPYSGLLFTYARDPKTGKLILTSSLNRCRPLDFYPEGVTLPQTPAPEFRAPAFVVVLRIFINRLTALESRQGSSASADSTARSKTQRPK